MTTIINATNIHRKFGEGNLVTHVLKGIDFQVKQGEFVAIMGRSGAGKSTLLYQLSVLDQPTEGSVVIDDTDVLKLNEKERTSFRLNTLGYIFQNYALIPDLSAEENVMVPLLMKGLTWEEARSKAQKSIDDVGMSGKYNNLPAELSGGEQQRISIARAIAGKPKILFADEPTANLDSVSGQQVIDLITTLNRENGQTIVMVTHEREYAVNCQRVVHIEDGKIVDEERLR
ncbi:ABC transporter ATP-binding protein [Candidatus Kaiserbacteria bacterium]|nr:ABC transporter ATP-binding protein [Candidatus Kaiserbacteria bacterium]USN92378.1 MAG: ABC transporter ATP-binding protein [Candidatus Nomurabacteria bacterium]